MLAALRARFVAGAEAERRLLGSFVTFVYAPLDG
jgi:hypothetical protein